MTARPEQPLRDRTRRPWSRAAKATLVIVIALVLVDGLLMVADLAHRLNTTRGIFPLFEDQRWNADRDDSRAELFGYLQLSAAAIALFVLQVRLKPPSHVYLSLAAIMAVIVIDDAFQVHETYGRVLRESLALQPALGVRPQDFGELIIWGVLGLVLGSWLLVSTLRSRRRERRVVRNIGLAGAILVFFGVGVDMVHIMVREALRPRENYLLNWAESAGELVGMTALFGVALLALLRSVFACPPTPAAEHGGAAFPDRVGTPDPTTRGLVGSAEPSTALRPAAH